MHAHSEPHRVVVLVSLTLLAPLSGASEDLTKILELNKSSCRNVEANLTFRDALGPTRALGEHNGPNSSRWALKDGNFVQEDLEDNGRIRTADLNRKDEYVSYSPGAKGTVLLRREVAPVESEGPLDFGFRAGSYWLGDLIKSGQLAVQAGADPDLVEVKGTLPSGSLCHAWLKPSIGGLAVRMILQNPTAGSSSEMVLDKWSSNGTSFFPLHGSKIIDLGRDSNVRFRNTELTVSDLKFGTVQDARFDIPPLTPGSMLVDYRDRKTWSIGPNGEKLFVGNVGHAEPTSMKPTYMGWMFVIGCGAALTSIAVYGRSAVQKRQAARAELVPESGS